MANTVGINLVANNTQALRAIRQTQDSLGTLNQAFGRLQSVIGGIALGALVRNTQQAAAAMSNLAQATGVNTASISAFSAALVSAGGTSDRARDAISDLTKNTGEAAAGSRELIDAFASLGIGLSDLANADQAEILSRTIAGLSAIPNQAERSALAMRLLGESVKGVDIGTLNTQFAAGAAPAQANAAAIESAAAANRALAENLNNLTLAITNLLKPFNDLVSGVAISVPTFESLIRAGAALAGGLFLLTGGLRNLDKGFSAFARSIRYATNGVKSKQSALRDLGRDLQGVGGSLSRYGKTVAGVEGYQTRLRTAILATVFGLARFAARLTGIIGVITFVVEAVNLLIRTITGFDALGFVFDKLGKGWDYVRERFLGYKKEAETPVDLDQDSDSVLEFQQQQLQQAQALREVIDEQKNKNLEVLSGIQGQNTELLKQYNLQTGLIGLSEANAQRAQELFTLEQQRVAAVAPLEREIARLSASRNELDRARVPLIQANIDAVNREFASTRTALESSIALRERERAIQQQQVDLEAALARRAEQRAQVEEAIAGITLGGINREREAADQARLDSLTGMQRTLAEIEIQERRVAEAARQRVAEQIGEDSTALAAALDRIDRASEAVIQRRQAQAQAIAAEQAQFSTGWNQALNQYLEQTQNAASQAESLFTTATRGMEDAIVGFVRTGKLNFKSLLSSIGEMILRSQLQRLIGSIFGGGGGGGGDSFLGSLFAGFFADGGRIPAGRVGVVGEAGPELVTGPATVTPRADLAQGGATSITYNISAVDSASFQALVARDPEFIYAVTEKGRRSLPGTRR